MPAIEVRGLERRFAGGIVAVAGIDLEVAEGEIYAFLGPNGAGKTTTVRMLTTLLRPTGGSAIVAGHDIVRQAADVRRSIGVALQEAALDPLMTGRELMHLQSTLHGIGRAEAERRSSAPLGSGSSTRAGWRPRGLRPLSRRRSAVPTSRWRSLTAPRPSKPSRCWHASASRCRPRTACCWSLSSEARGRSLRWCVRST